MKKKSLITLIVLTFISGVYAQNAPKIYKPSANAKADIEAATRRAAKEGKHVFLQIGGNWCVWCLRFNTLVTQNDTLRRALQSAYVPVHVNYSKENKNEEVLASLDYPQRFGFPVFVILDAKGRRLHTQNSAYLEEAGAHSPKKVLEFLNHWSPAALNAAAYKKAN